MVWGMNFVPVLLVQRELRDHQVPVAVRRRAPNPVLDAGGRQPKVVHRRVDARQRQLTPELARPEKWPSVVDVRARPSVAPAEDGDAQRARAQLPT